MLHLIFFDTEDKLLKSKQTNKQTNKQTKSQQKLEHWKKKQQTSVFPISLIHSSTFSPHVTSAKVCLHSISAMFEAVSSQFLIFAQ